MLRSTSAIWCLVNKTQKANQTRSLKWQSHEKLLELFKEKWRLKSALNRFGISRQIVVVSFYAFWSEGFGMNSSRGELEERSTDSVIIFSFLLTREWNLNETKNKNKMQSWMTELKLECASQAHSISRRWPKCASSSNEFHLKCTSALLRPELWNFQHLPRLAPAQFQILMISLIHLFSPRVRTKGQRSNNERSDLKSVLAAGWM